MDVNKGATVADHDTRDSETAPPTQLIVLGGAALTDGFRLLGAETVADATPEDLKTLLDGLRDDGGTALLMIEADLARRGEAVLRRARRRGNRLAIVEIPSLTAPEAFQPYVETLVERVLGASALER